MSRFSDGGAYGGLGVVGPTRMDYAGNMGQVRAVARYVGEVAAAGKAAYPLPLYANAALRDPIAPGPTVNWESGGPTDDVLPIWKAAAPALDLLAPDIYLDDHSYR